jgi:pimeloyl-ACP methyl ester carboxylesterase
MPARTTIDWTLPGAAGEVILGEAHPPAAGATVRLAVVMAHGHMSYKGYGFQPLLAADLAARLPAVVHRFTFSHAGVTQDHGPFDRPDLFERSTWDHMVHDLAAVSAACVAGRLPSTPPGTPVALVGHSRGGIACLLYAGRLAARTPGARPGPIPLAIVTIGSGSWTLRYTPQQRRRLAEEGFLVEASSRTGQILRVGRAWMQSILDAPADHDLLALCAEIERPVLVLHGDADDTIPISSSEQIAGACPNATRLVIRGATHVLNTPNPADDAAARSAQLKEAEEAIVRFLQPAMVQAGC